MIDATIKTELAACLDTMSLEHQRRVLEFARALASRPPKGVPGRELLRFAGTIEESDLDAMSQAIEEGCERVDANGW